MSWAIDVGFSSAQEATASAQYGKFDHETAYNPLDIIVYYRILDVFAPRHSVEAA
jgi:hypothetical protein